MRALLVAALFALAACTGKPSFEDPSLSKQKLDLETFFVNEILN